MSSLDASGKDQEIASLHAKIDDLIKLVLDMRKEHRRDIEDLLAKVPMANQMYQSMTDHFADFLNMHEIDTSIIMSALHEFIEDPEFPKRIAEIKANQEKRQGPVSGSKELFIIE